MANNYPNTQSLVEGHSAGGAGVQANAMNTGLSTQIIIKVHGNPVGALQRLTVAQARPLFRVQEIGTDGVIEIVPQNATTFELTAERIVFDQLRLPESFSKGFRFINSQRLPFDIEVIDFSGTAPNAVIEDNNNLITMTYRNCWFTRYDTPYTADNYVITETGTLWCETAFLSTPTTSAENGIPYSGGLRGIQPTTDNAGIEQAVNIGDRRGSMDASGVIKSIFG